VTEVAVWILHPEPGPAAGPLERLLSAARRDLAERHRAEFIAAGATSAVVVSGPPDDTPFGARIRELVGETRAPGVLVLGSGAMPLARRADRRDFLAVAASGTAVALANNRFSADAVAIGCAERLLQLPDLAADNALPRWLEEVAGYEVRDLRRRWRLGMDLDSPLDLALLGDRDGVFDTLAGRLDAFATVAADRAAELIVTGRTNAASIGWLETHTSARVRALVEERGLRASGSIGPTVALRAAPQRSPRSVLGLVLDRDGPRALGARLADLADAALVDTRVLLAHRLGPDESRWPSTEDRFASDLLVADQIADPWLRELTESATSASIPVVLGGHSLVGPGVRLAVGRRSRG
jgi:hypothetical protein